jgi:endo-1,4-beta-xylanase
LQNSEEDGTWRSTVFYDTLNTTFVATALHAAREADPDTKLYVNDYNIEGINSKSTAYINLVSDLKAQNVPVDGIGLQAHLIVGSIPGDIQQNIERMATLGVEVPITPSLCWRNGNF